MATLLCYAPPEDRPHSPAYLIPSARYTDCTVQEAEDLAETLKESAFMYVRLAVFNDCGQLVRDFRCVNGAWYKNPQARP